MNDRSPARAGPLQGVRVVDLSALGPGPFCSMVLADFGADVVHVRRPGATGPDPSAFMRRGKREVVIDLRRPTGAEVVARMADHADVLLEGNRPGAMERRGLGPEVLLARNPRLVYTRLTGWGQHGPYSHRAGHDVNYLAVSGALGVIGIDEPVPPLALLGDLASGAIQAALGTVLALFERERTGAGQVVDAAIVDGAALLLTPAFGELTTGFWSGTRGTHALSGTAPFYGVYECADGGWFSLGAIEPQFYAAALTILDLDDDPEAQWATDRWPELRRRMAGRFLSQARGYWTERFAAVDACGAPVLEIDELDADEHLAARGTVRRVEGRLTAGVAPRLSRHPDLAPGGDPAATSPAVLGEFGFTTAEIETLVDDGVVRGALG